MDKSVEIGMAILYYNEDGTLSSGDFTPATYNIETDEFLDRLKFIGNENDDQIEEHAKVILSGWFSRMNSIELADRENYEIAASIIECIRWQNGTTRKCALKFTLKSKRHETAS